MSERRVNLLLWMSAAICAGGAVLLLALATLTPLDAAVHVAMPTTRPASKGRATGAMPALAEFEPIFNARLRPAPAEAPSPVAVVSDAAPAAVMDRPALTLVGTIGQSLAMFRNERGEVDLKGVGDTAGGATVTSIQASRVEMQHNGRSIVLEKPKEPAAGS